MALTLQKTDLLDCLQRISPLTHRTPVLSSSLINEIAGCKLHFKCENFQRMGAFKMRGASNAILQLSDKQRAKGVVTHSSGNFAQALSLAAKSLGVKAYIVMPIDAPSVKKIAALGYGAEIIDCEGTLTSREETAASVEKEKGATFIHPSNDDQVIAGQATAAMELLEDHPKLNSIITPVGGGGLLAGTALAAHYFGNRCQTYGGEPETTDDAFRSLQSGKIETNESTATIADGLKSQLGDKTFPVIQALVEEIILVSEKEIIAAMKLIWERMKIVIETSSAVALAAVLKQQSTFRNKNVGVIISGGNVDLSQLPF